MFVFLNIDRSLHNCPFIYRGDVISLQNSSVRGDEQRKRAAGIRGGAKSKVARVGIYDRGAPAFLPGIWRAGASGGWSHTHAKRAPSFSHEVSSGRLAPFLSAAPDSTRHLRPFGGTLGGESLSSLARPLARVLATKNMTGKRAGRGAQISTGVALRPVGGDFPDTEICLRREPPHPREALPTSDIDFPGENRGVSTIFHWFRKGEGEGWQEEKQNDCFRPLSSTLRLYLYSLYLLFFFPSIVMYLFYLSKKLLHINSLNFAFSQFIKIVNCAYVMFLDYIMPFYVSIKTRELNYVK